MKISAKIYQETINTFYFVDGEQVNKTKDGYFFEDGTKVLTESEIETKVVTRESWSFPVSGESKGKSMTENRLKAVCDHIADTLEFSAKTATVRGRKFTNFSLNKPVQILVTLNGSPILFTKEIAKLYNTFRLTYTESKEGNTERKQFTKEELSEGLFNIFMLADRVNQVFNF